MSGQSVRIDLALARAKRGEIVEAAQELTAILKSEPSNTDAYYHLARLYAHAGRREAAASVFRLAISMLPRDFLDAQTFVRYEGAAFDAPTALAFFDGLADTEPSIRQYLKPSPIVGSYEATPGVEQDRAIRELLDARWSAWQSGHTPRPKRADCFRERSLPRDAPWPRIMILLTKHVSGNPDFIASTFASHTVASLVDLGIEAAFHPADDLCIDVANPDSGSVRKPKEQALTALDEHMAAFRPDIVVMDAMFEESPRSLSRADLAQLKAKHGFKLISLIGDGYPPLPNYAAHWAALSDLTVSFSDRGYLAAVAGATFAAPCQALATSLLASSADGSRDIALCYIGSRRRNRDFWCAHVIHAGIDATVILTDRRAPSGLVEADYYRLMGRAQLVLNNGDVGAGIDHVITFRIFETIASGALLLNHAVSELTDYFTPYVHYVPFANVHELVCFARFLCAHPEYRDRMAAEAKAWLMDHYSAELFWRGLFSRLPGN